MAQHYYSSQAVQSHLVQDVTAGATSVIVDANTFVGYPTSYPFTIRLEPGTANEELCDVTAAPTVAGSQVTVPVTRAVDGGTARAHSSGSAVDHGLAARDLTEAASHVYGTTGVHGLASDARPLGYQGASRKCIGGQFTGTPDASGFLTVTHGLSVTPIIVLVTPAAPSGGSPILSGVICDTISATTFRVRCINTSGGAFTGVAASINWLALG